MTGNRDPNQPMSLKAQRQLVHAYELLGQLRQKVDQLWDLDEPAARQIMGMVSTFETDWWGSHGD